MKTIIEMAREAGFVSAQFWPDDFKGLQASVERFAALVEAEHTERLLDGVEMPEAVGSAEVFSGHNAHGLPEYAYVDAYTADQMRDYAAAAVLRKDAEIANLKAENERLRNDLAAMTNSFNALKGQP